MNDRYYEDIFESFKRYHPYMIKDVNDWRPRGDKGIRVTLNDNAMYDYDIVTRGVRRVIDYGMNSIDDITEEQCRASIGYHLTEQMSLKGFSQQTLADYTGLGKGSIYNYINGKATPSATALRKIAHALECSIADLLD